MIKWKKGKTQTILPPQPPSEAHGFSERVYTCIRKAGHQALIPSGTLRTMYITKFKTVVLGEQANSGFTSTFLCEYSAKP